MSESEYKKAVLAAYDAKKKIPDALSAELLSPTPANIKAEVLIVCEKRFNGKDEKTLRSFYGEKENKEAYYKAIDTSSADPFRPLTTVLRDRSVNTHLRNIDLLAWLIDYNPRPFHYTLVPPVIVTETGKADFKIKQTKKQSPMVLLVAALIIIIGLTGYLFLEKQPEHYTGHDGCMVWNDDHYEPTDCNDHSTGKTLYPIKHDLVDYFKKINDPKTLAPDSKAWYAKYKGNVEFFTDSGPYPLDTNRRVLPVTPHIYDKYILHNTN